LPGQPGTNVLHSEVEPRVAVNPVNPRNIVCVWQQDRWDSGGCRGLVAGVSSDGGTTWQEVVLPGLTPCTGGTYPRASGPWASVGPTGALYVSGFLVDRTSGQTAVTISKSTDGGLTWDNPIFLADDTGQGFANDKESVTADPTDARFAYAVW